MPRLTQIHSPAELEFGPRRKQFDIEQSLARDWFGDSAFKTAWFNALSMLFPLGEKFFIDSVVHFKKQIDDPRMLEEINGFQAQEATHRVQHQKYNEKLCELRGYNLARIERDERKRMEWAYRNLSPLRCLAGTAANEHLTAIMAHDMLTNEDSLQGADEGVAALWRWHGIEETEHKAVAYDVYHAVGGTVAGRRQALLYSTFFFFKDTFRNLIIMLQHDGKLWCAKEWLAGVYFLFVRPGFLRRAFLPWLSFMRKNFHPWDNDNRNLIVEWERQQTSSERE